MSQPGIRTLREGPEQLTGKPTSTAAKKCAIERNKPDALLCEDDMSLMLYQVQSMVYGSG